MQCEYHPSVEAVAECESCSLPMCGICANYTSSSVLCDRCLEAGETAELVEAQRKPKDQFGRMLGENPVIYEEPRKAALEASIEKREKLHMAIVICSVIFIGIRVATSIGSATLLTQQQIREEEFAIQQLNDCVTVFWEIAGIMSNGGVPDASLACTESSAPNIITRNGSEVTISHPNPAYHGYKQIFVASNNPVPMFVLE